MRWWKWLGLAGVAGVTATGVAVARAERRRRAYTPDEVRQRLHARLAAAGEGPSAASDRDPSRGQVRQPTHLPGRAARTRRRVRGKLAKVLRGRAR